PGDGKAAWVKWQAATGASGNLGTDGSNGSSPFGLAEVPAGATVLNVEWVAVAYRESGGDHPSPDLSDPFSSATYPTLNPRYQGDGTFFAGRRIEPLP